MIKCYDKDGRPVNADILTYPATYGLIHGMQPTFALKIMRSRLTFCNLILKLSSIGAEEVSEAALVLAQDLKGELEFYINLIENEASEKPKGRPTSKNGGEHYKKDMEVARIIKAMVHLNLNQGLSLAEMIRASNDKGELDDENGYSGPSEAQIIRRLRKKLNELKVEDISEEIELLENLNFKVL